MMIIDYIELKTVEQVHGFWVIRSNAINDNPPDWDFRCLHATYATDLNLLLCIRKSVCRQYADNYFRSTENAHLRMHN